MKRKIRYVVCTAGIMFVSAILWAHEFWLQPSQFFVQPGSVIKLHLLVGENFNGDSWANRSTRTDKLLHYQYHKVTDITASIKNDDTTACNIRLSEAGTHLLYLHSNPSYIALDADKFNDYLADDGLDNIVALRQQNKELNKPARERYERFSKTFIQCGNVSSPLPAAQNDAMLDMQLLNNPYTINSDNTLQIQAFFNQRPLTNKKIVAWHKTKEGVFQNTHNYLTGADGKIS